MPPSEWYRIAIEPSNTLKMGEVQMRIISHTDWSHAVGNRHPESNNLQRLAIARELVVVTGDGKFNRPLPTGSFEEVGYDDSVNILINEHLQWHPNGSTQQEADALLSAIVSHPSVSDRADSSDHSHLTKLVQSKLSLD
jgi:hypothetical protein